MRTICNNNLAEVRTLDDAVHCIAHLAQPPRSPNETSWRYLIIVSTHIFGDVKHVIEFCS